MILAIDNLKGIHMTDYLNYYWTDYNLTKESDNYVLELDVPGFKKDEINISFEKKNSKNYLFVNGKNDKRKYNNSFIVHDGFDLNKIKASLVDGVLKIALKLRQEEENRTKIQID